MPQPDTAPLTGRTEGHLCSSADAELLGVRVHRDVVQPFLQLKDEARQAGFDLRILSGFRSFEQQLSIWNRKATGKRAVLDSSAVPLDIGRLSEKELVFAILRWSALPGASRHHWGTDLDVYDAASRPEGYEIELIPEEVDAGGMFGPLHEWLDGRIAADSAYGFFRPYDADRQGVAPERWHLSYGPTAATYQQRLTTELLGETIQQADIELKEVVLQNMDEIYQRFVTNTNRPVA
ncbi:MAG: M15 family metallopeptidase [Planctomycetota bacterium]|jgi:LAS superfamily LD-carboxypeptidase LdcB